MPRADAPWSGRAAARARSIVRSWLPAPCGRCGVTITDGIDQWVVGHIVARSADPSLTWVVRNWQPEHRRCSNSSSQSAVIDKAQRDGALKILNYLSAGYQQHEDVRRFLEALAAGVRRGEWPGE